MIVRLVEELSPELFELLSLPASPGAAVEVEVDVETGTSALVVRTLLSVLLPLTVTTVDVTCWVWLRTDFDSTTMESSDRVEIMSREDWLSLEDLEVKLSDDGDEVICD